MRTLILILVAAVVVIASQSPCLSKSYSVESVEVEATARPDGSLRVVERITYDFSGEFSFAFRDIPLKPGEDLYDIEVTEDGRSFARSGSESPGTYSVSADGSGRKITWHYSAENQKRTFVFSYTVSGVVRRFYDVAEIYYMFIGQDWDHAIGRVDVVVRLPESVRQSDVRAWAHGPLHGTVRILPEGEVAFFVAPLPSRTYWEGRITCPASSFPGVALAKEGDRLNEILVEEARWVNEANRQREVRKQRIEDAARDRESRQALAKKLFPIAIFLGVAGLGIGFQYFNRFGRPHPVVSRTVRGEMPSDHSPAVLAYLMNRTVSGPAMVATLMDLANRGFLEIHETVADKKVWFGKTKKEVDYRFDVVAKSLEELVPYERELLQFMLNEAGDSTGFSMSAFKKAALKNRTGFQKWFRKWVKEVSEYGKSLGFFEPYPVGAMVLNGLCGLGIMLAGMAFILFSEPYAGIPALVGGFIQAVLTAFLSRRTPEGRRLQLGWRDFKKHLKTIARGLGPVTLGSDDWSRYLGAAIVFGMHKELIPKLQVAGERGVVVYPVWFYGGAGGSFEQSVAGLSTGFSTMIATMSTSMSSASGAGGGASGGGGGGSGGGGGGAG